MVQLKIKVTKEHLKQSALCGHVSADDLVGNNCAIALAVRDIFPNAYVGAYDICTNGYEIDLPESAQYFIMKFDCYEPQERMTMPELEFEVSIPDEIVERINIDELRPLLANHPTLSLI